MSINIVPCIEGINLYNLFFFLIKKLSYNFFQLKILAINKHK